MPVDMLRRRSTEPIEYFMDCLGAANRSTGRCRRRSARIGQQIVDSAMLSAKGRRTVSLVE